VADPSRADPGLDARIDELLAEAGVVDDRDLVHEIVASGIGLGLDDADRLDLKITTAAVREMREAFRMFAPYGERAKVTIFGSARTTTDDPLYRQTVEVAQRLADHGWMVITGAGPGIMRAAMEGAGVEQSIGVSIRLPFEERPNDIIHGDAKHVAMKYFFTRKLMLVKESKGFIALPGGFGTLDETLELLTLQQTGKSEPTPIVLLDVPGGTYWTHFARFVTEELAGRGLVAADDLSRVCVTDSVEVAAEEITGFWRNYHSLRFVGTTLVLRLRFRPTDDEVAALHERFAPILAKGTVRRIDPLPPEVDDGDHLELHRIAMVIDPYEIGDLHQVIRALNALPSAAGD
jgi:uncharacterized protein (TIGR00730 family)